jgi:CBS domain-containing protein
MLKAKDIMTKDVVTVRPDTPILEAVELLVEQGITGIPVVKNDMTLAGVLSESDLMGLLYRLNEAKDEKVEDFMTTPAVHFDVQESLVEVCNCLIESPFRRVPITSQGKVVGIISRKDVVKYIVRMMHEPAAAKALD